MQKKLPSTRIRLISAFVIALVPIMVFPLDAHATTLTTDNYGQQTLNNSYPGTISNTDCTNPARGDGFYGDLFKVSQTSVVRVYHREGPISGGLRDPWLQIVGPDRKTVLAQDDDGGADDNGDGASYSSYLHDVTVTPDDFIIATTIGAGQLGSYTLFSNVPLTQVTSCPQVITMNVTGSSSYGNTINLTASTNISEPVTLESTTPSVCTVASSNTPNFSLNTLNIGTCTIRATQPGNGSSIEAAPEVIRNITITQRALTLTGLSGTTKDWDGTTSVPLAGTPAISGVVNSDDVTLSGTAVGTYASSAAGSRTVTISGLNLAGAQASRYTFPSTLPGTINRINQTITWSPTTTSFLPSNSGHIFAAASATGDGSVSYSVQNAGSTGCTVNSGTRALSFSTVGTCVIRATASGTNYNSATTDVSFTINMLEQANLSWSPTEILKPSQSGRTFAAATGGVGTVSYTVQNMGSTGCTVSGRVLSFTSQGSCLVRATAASTTDYMSATREATFIISKLNQIMTWAPETSLSAQNTTQALGAASTSGDGQIVYSVVNAGVTGCTISGSSVSFTATGTCRVKATAASTSDYNEASAELDFIISIAPQTLSWVPTRSVSVAARTLTPSALPVASGSGSISYQVVDAGTTACTVNSDTGVLSFTKAGECRVRAVSAATAMESAANTEVVFTITPTSQTLTWRPANTSIDTSRTSVVPSVLASSSGSGAIRYSLVSSSGARCSVNPSSGELTYAGAGSCVVRATAASTDSETSAFVDVTFLISEAIAIAPSPTPSVLAAPRITEVLGEPVKLRAGSAVDVVSSNGEVVRVTIGSNGLPALTPLQSMAVVDGVSVPFTLAPAPSLTGLILEGSNFGISISASSNPGSQDPLNSQGELVFTAGKFATFSGTGFAPNTEVVVWIFSDPRQLGKVMTDAEGNFSGELALPEDLEVGEHTLQLNGLSDEGETRSLAVGVELLSTENPDSNWIAWLGVGGLSAAVLGLISLAIFRSRRNPSQG